MGPGHPACTQPLPTVSPHVFGRRCPRTGVWPLCRGRLGVTEPACPSSDSSAPLFLTETWSPPQRTLPSRLSGLTSDPPLPSEALSGGDATLCSAWCSPRAPHPCIASRPIVLRAPFHRWGSRGLRGFCKRSRLEQAGGRPPPSPPSAAAAASWPSVVQAAGSDQGCCGTSRACTPSRRPSSVSRWAQRCGEREVGVLAPCAGPPRLSHSHPAGWSSTRRPR